MLEEPGRINILVGWAFSHGMKTDESEETDR
jgi:hypothetical protein